MSLMDLSGSVQLYSFYINKKGKISVGKFLLIILGDSEFISQRHRDNGCTQWIPCRLKSLVTNIYIATSMIFF